MASSLFVLSGPSAAGKGTVIRRVVERCKDLEVAVSATVRPPRRGEEDGRDYYFLTRRSFQARVRSGAFLEWAEVHGQLYGTLKEEVERILSEGKKVLLEVDVQGALAVRRQRKDAVLIFLTPRRVESLYQRIRDRGTESPADMARRLEGAAKELREAKQYDYLVFNDRLEEAVSGVVSIVKAGGLRMRADLLGSLARDAERLARELQAGSGRQR